MKKQFLKIAGVKTEAAFYKKYPTEEAFFAAHPEARNMMAMGGTPEAFPQIATFDRAFSYGVPPGPQYLAKGGSAFPQAQTEAQFFIPIYTDVYNPYNKAMGGSNVEMYPNAKVMPHWGPTNVWFQDGGQEGMTQEQPELDRLGVQNRTGAFANMLKATAAKSNARTAMNQVGMAKYGKELSIYAPGGYTINPNQRIASNITQQMSPTSSQFAGDTMPPTYNQQLQANLAAAMMQQAYGYNPMAMGNMNNFLPSVYNWNDPSQFMFQVKGSPNWKFKTDIPGMGKRRGVSNISLGEAWGLYSGDPAAREEALKKLNPSRITETPVGLFKKRTRRDYYWDGTPQSNTTFKDWGTGTAGQQAAPFNQATSAYGPYADGFKFGPDGTPVPSPYGPYTGGYQFAPDGLQSVPPTSTPTASQPAAASSSANPDADYIRNSKYPDLDQPFTGTNMTQRERLLQQLNSSDPKEVEYAKYRIGAMSDWDAMQGSTTTTSQAPSNANSMDAATAQKKASMMNPNVNQAYVDAQRVAAQQATSIQRGTPATNPQNITQADIANMLQISPFYKTSDDATGYKFGGSYNKGDVVYMTDDEIAEFIKNGGQIEEID